MQDSVNFSNEETEQPPPYRELYPNSGGINQQCSVCSTNQFASDSESILRILKACDFAAQRHSFQRRKDVHQTPYINHPIGIPLFLDTC